MNVDITTTKNKYQIIYADPPWSYSDKGCSGAAAEHYDTMSVADIAALPVKEIADKTAVLFLWATYPKLDEALAVIKAWGFTFKSIAFQWVKLNKSADKAALSKVLETSATVEEALKKVCFFGLGRWTRGNSEPCLIAVKGKPTRESASVGQLVFAPLGKHSAKPAEVRDRITQLVGGGIKNRTVCKDGGRRMGLLGQRSTARQKASSVTPKIQRRKHGRNYLPNLRSVDRYKIHRRRRRMLSVYDFKRLCGGGYALPKLPRNGGKKQ